MDGTSFLTSDLPYLVAIQRLGLAVALGLFVGLERERRGKEAGVRTFAFAALIGCFGGLLGEAFALASLALIGLLIIFQTIHAVLTDHGSGLTTTAALVVIGFVGILCGQGHKLTPTAVAVLTAGLLTWKESLVGFSLGLTEKEVRSAILLAILALVVYPALPNQAIDPWKLIEPRTAWITVILIAGIGFGNYILLKLYGSKGVELTGFFGGLVNSTLTVTELASRVRQDHTAMAMTYRGVILATIAMLLRNGVLLAILAPRALLSAVPAAALMLLTSMALLLLWRPKKEEVSAGNSGLALQSPFSLQLTIKFGLIFLVLEMIGTVSQWWLGRFGFYAVSLLGGTISSASAVASAASLARKGVLSPDVAGIGAILASLTSTLINLPLVARLAHEQRLTRMVFRSLGLIVFAGILGAIVGPRFASYVATHFTLVRP